MQSLVKKSMLPREALRLTCAGAGPSLERPVLRVALGAVVCACQSVVAQPHRLPCSWQRVGKPGCAPLGTAKVQPLAVRAAVKRLHQLSLLA